MNSRHTFFNYHLEIRALMVVESQEEYIRFHFEL